MSESGATPSWLHVETVTAAAAVGTNPAVQRAALSAAKNPAVQASMKKELSKSKSVGPPPPPKSAKPSGKQDSSAPGWVNGKSTGDEEAGQTAPEQQAGSEKTNDFVIEEAVLAEMGKYHLALRVLYCVAAIIMCTAAVISLQNQSDIGLAFFAIYVCLFCTLVCCFEVAWSAVARILAVNFGFMYTFYGRMAFIFFLIFMVFSIGSILAYVGMGCMLVVLLYHFYVMYKFPRFEEYLRKKHYYEGRRETAGGWM